MSKREPYIKAITSLGKRKLIPISKFRQRISAYMICVEDGKVLLLTNRFTGKLCLPGGEVELGEFFEKTLKREGKEEISTDKIRVGALVGVAENFFYYDSTDEALHVAMVFYKATVSHKEEIKDTGDEHEGNPMWYEIMDLQEEQFGELLKGSFLGMIKQAW